MKNPPCVSMLAVLRRQVGENLREHTEAEIAALVTHYLATPHPKKKGKPRGRNAPRKKTPRR